MTFYFENDQIKHNTLVITILYNNIELTFNLLNYNVSQFYV